MTQQSDLQTERIYMAEHDKLKLQQAIRIQTQTKKHQRICLVSLTKFCYDPALEYNYM